MYCNRGQVKHYTFKIFMQGLDLTFKYETENFSHKDGKKLPCPLMEGGCEITTLKLFCMYLKYSRKKYCDEGFDPKNKHGRAFFDC